MQIPANITFDESKIMSLFPVRIFWTTMVLSIVCAMMYGIAYWRLSSEVVLIRSEHEKMKELIVAIVQHGPENIRIVPPTPDTDF